VQVTRDRLRMILPCHEALGSSGAGPDGSGRGATKACKEKSATAGNHTGLLL
jgi:hypothetical protein